MFIFSDFFLEYGLIEKYPTTYSEQELVSSIPYPSVPIHPQNTSNKMNTPPPSYPQATAIQMQTGYDKLDLQYYMDVKLYFKGMIQN